MFTLHSSTSSGRRATLSTPHGAIETPFFMPVATAGAMKGITLGDLHTLDAQLLLANTYHLHLQPGEDIVKSAGGLHGFMNWEKPILTDSGGFQVYSLRRTNVVTDDGVTFHSHLNGDALFMGPKESIEIQHKLGSDIIMCFDECPPSTASRLTIEKAVERTIAWAKVCKEHHQMLSEGNSTPPLLFGIVQGGLHPDLREHCAKDLISIGFDGYAIGGLAVGESEEDMLSVVECTIPHLPEDAPRYLMGVGVTHQLRECVSRGIDMFDCVLPMRVARHGTILLSEGGSIRITNSEFREDYSSIDSNSLSELSRNHSRSYLHHLMRAKERYGETIASLQNLSVTLQTMQHLRQQIESES